MHIATSEPGEEASTLVCSGRLPRAARKTCVAPGDGEQPRSLHLSPSSISDINTRTRSVVGSSFPLWFRLARRQGLLWGERQWGSCVPGGPWGPWTTWVSDWSLLGAADVGVGRAGRPRALHSEMDGCRRDGCLTALCPKFRLTWGAACLQGALWGTVLLHPHGLGCRGEVTAICVYC